MAFRVEISPQAFTDLDDIAAYIKLQASFDRAEEWFNGIVAAIRTLEHSPNRCPIANESEDLNQEVHVLLYGKRNRKYRVYYSIQQRSPSKGKVSVFHIRHWARKSLSPDQLRDLKSGRNR